jgi:dUTP pyrophosphatase
MSFDKLKMINEIYADRQETVKFSRMYDDVILPSKKDGDAGYDIYARLPEEMLVIEPHQTVLISTGLRVWVPEGYYMQLFERGSTGTKGIAQRAGVIDSSYTGEILVPITNVNPDRLILAKPGISIPPGLENIWDNYQTYYTNKAITQGVILPVPNFPVKEISEEEMLARNTERGQGRLGSSRK